MFQRIVVASINQPWIVLALALLLTGIGIDVARRQPVDVLPDLTRPTITVHTEATGLSPADVESLVTRHVEVALAGLPSVERIRSVSSTALSLAYAEFAWGSDPYRNRQLVAERLDATRNLLPPGVQPRIGPLSSLMGEVMLIALQTDAEATDRHLRELRDLADWTLSPALLSVPGVSQVTVIGGETLQYEIRPDPQRMALLGVTLQQIGDAAGGFGRDEGGGFVEANGQDLSLRLRGRPFSIEALRETPVDWRNGAAVRLGQVAGVVEASRPRRGDAGADGRAAVILAIQKQPDVDTPRLTAALEQRLAALSASLPAGCSYEVLFRQADFIERSTRNVGEALLHAALIAALVLFAFLASGRATLASLIAIPLSMLSAVLVLHLLGQSINTMTLGGLAIAVGELVDDAVVGTENVIRRLRQRHPTSAGVGEIIAAATIEVRSGILHATWIVVLVFVPLFALDGIAGRLFAPLGIAYIAAIVASLIVAMTVTPVLCHLAYADRAKSLPREAAWLVRLRALYLRALRVALDWPRALLAVSVALVVAALAVGLHLPRAFLPAFNEGTLTLNLILQPGIGLSESSRIGRLAEQALLQIPEVAHVGRRTGRAELDEHAEGLHYSELELILRDSARDRQDVLHDIRTHLADLPGQLAISQPISHRLDHLLSGVRAPLVVKLIGDDDGVLRHLAEQLRPRLADIDGLADVQIEAQAEVPELDIHIDPAAAAQYGIAAAVAQKRLSQLLVGQPLSTIVDGERQHALVLRLADAQRTPEALRHLLIDGPAGPVALSSIADIRERSGPNQISRENLRRRLTISLFAAGTGFAQAGVDVQRLIAAVPVPPGYGIRVEGQLVAQQSAMARLSWLAALSLLLMAVIVYARYRSLVLTLIVLGNVPLALVGGAIALWLSGAALSVASVVGFVTLAGIAVRNGILKISHYLNLALQEDLPFGPELILRGSAERLAPVLMTALITALALLPLLGSSDVPGKEILHPVALVIFGGLIGSTLLDSFVTPALFLRYGQRAIRRANAQGFPRDSSAGY